MVQIYKAHKPKKNNEKKLVKSVLIDKMSTQGEGVCTSHRPPIYVKGALLNETLDIRVTQAKKDYWNGELASSKSIQNPHASRQDTFCRYFEQCGGCTTQYCDPKAMLAFKQSALDEQFKSKLKIDNLPWCDAIQTAHRGYRRKARLAVDARNSKSIKVGFRAQGSSKIIGTDTCLVLEAELQHIMLALHKRIEQKGDAYKALRFVGHITLMQVNSSVSVTVSCTRSVSSDTVNWWKAFADDINTKERQSAEVNLVANNESVACFFPSMRSNQPAATDFIQVNASVNEQMLDLVLQTIENDTLDCVLELFCGLGNFSFKLAEQAQRLIGVEGSEAMVQTAQAVAQQNGVDNTEFIARNLNEASSITDLLKNDPNLVFLDPSREGAFAVCEQLANNYVAKIVYISCNPQTWLRDSRVLLNNGYSLSQLTLMDMFPYTPHSELFSVFTYG